MELILFLLLSFSATSFAQTISANQLDQLKDLSSGQKLAISKTGKKDKILYFWATWCPDCKEKLTKDFNKESLKSKFDIYLVSTEKDLDKVAHFQKKHEIASTIVVDEEKSLQKSLGVFSVPTMVRLRPQGDSADNFKIISKQSGGNLDDLLNEAATESSKK